MTHLRCQYEVLSRTSPVGQRTAAVLTTSLRLRLFYLLKFLTTPTSAQSVARTPYRMILAHRPMTGVRSPYPRRTCTIITNNLHPAPSPPGDLRLVLQHLCNYTPYPSPCLIQTINYFCITFTSNFKRNSSVLAACQYRIITTTSGGNIRALRPC